METLFIAYLFADGDSSDAQIFGDDGDEAIVKCGTATTDAAGVLATDVDLGFEPQWLLVKRSNSTGAWNLFDTMRGFHAEKVGNNKYVRPNNTNAEANNASVDGEFITATGFGTNGNGVMGSANATFIYLAIRRGPMKEPSAGTDVYNAVNRTGGGGSASITGVGFSPDFYLSKATNQGAYNPVLYNRLRSKRYLLTNSTNAQAGSDGGLASYDMDGVSVESGSTFGLDGSGDSIINYFSNDTLKYLIQLYMLAQILH